MISSTETVFSIPGGQIYTKSWTPSSATKEPLVLLHDSLGCVATWRNFPELLAAATSRQVIAYDRLGFGRSSPRKERPSLRFVNEESESTLPALFNALNIDSFSLFGHSVGGAMAIVAAAGLAGRCRAVITESAQAFVEEKTRQGIRQAQEDFKNPELLRKLEKYHGEKTKWVLDAWINVWLSSDFADWSLTPDLPRIQCPILVIHGDQDDYGSLQFPEMICEKTGGDFEKHILTGCGHVPHRERQDEVLNLVTGFLA